MNETNTEVLPLIPPQAINQANPFTERASLDEAKPKRNSLLSTITRKRRRRPILAVLAGPPGLGKSTLLTEAPDPVFSPVERGLDSINVPKFDTPNS